MKKIYALAAVACMAMAANAQNGAPLYSTGDGEGMGTWNPAQPAEYTYADGVYTLKSNNLTSFKISTAKSELPKEGEAADWTAFNNAALTCDYGTEQGVAVALTAGDGNINCPWLGDWTITVAGDLSTVTLTTDTPKPTGGPVLYFRGDMNGWGNAAEDLDAWKLEVIDEDALIYKYVCDDEHFVKAGDTFKIATDPWNVCNLGANPTSDNPELIVEASVAIDDLRPLFKGDDPGNLTMSENWRGVVYLQVDLTANAAGSFVMFCADKDAECPFELGAVEGITVDSNAPAAYYTIQGVRVSEPANGLYIVVKDGKATKVIR